MTILFLVASLVIVLALFTLVAIMMWNSSSSKQAPEKELLNEDEVIVRWLNELMREPNPFSQLASYSSALKANRAKAAQASEVIDIFFHELSIRTNLKEIGAFSLIVPFDPSLHRSSHNVKPGESVYIVKPGWKFKGYTLKYPVVQRVRDN